MAFVLEKLLIPVLLLFLLLVSILGLAIGIGLVFRSAATLRFFGTMNRWVSTRKPLKPLEVTRDAERAAKRHALWFGLVLAIAGGYALVMLLSAPDAGRISSALGLGVSRYSAAAVLIDFAKWLLVAGSGLAVATGVLLAFFPRLWSAIEARANLWVSSRQMMAGGDTMHFAIDRWVEASPRTAGWIITALSLASTLASGALAIGRM